MVFCQDLLWALSWYEARITCAQLATWSIEAQEKPWNKTGGMTPWMASTASARALKSSESETTPPIIAQLCNVTCLPP